MNLTAAYYFLHAPLAVFDRLGSGTLFHPDYSWRSKADQGPQYKLLFQLLLMKMTMHKVELQDGAQASTKNRRNSYIKKSRNGYSQMHSYILPYDSDTKRSNLRHILKIFPVYQILFPDFC